MSLSLKTVFLILFLSIPCLAAPTMPIFNETTFTVPQAILDNFTAMDSQINELKTQLYARQLEANTFKTQISFLDDFMSKLLIKTELIMVASALFLGVGIGINLLLVQTKVKEFFELMKMRYDLRPLNQQIKEDIKEITPIKTVELTKPKKLNGGEGQGWLAKIMPK